MNCRKAHLTIGDIVFSSFCEEGVITEEENGSVYSPFISGKPPMIASFHTEVIIGYKGEGANIVEELGWSHLFEGNPSWALFQKSNDLRFSFHSLNSKQSNLTATCRNNFRQIDIEYGPMCLIRNRLPAVLSNPLRYPLDQLLLIHILAQEGGGILLHAAGVEHQGRAYLFAGISGAGKSTIAGLLGHAPEIEPVNDDRIVVRKKERGGYAAYGTPWPGEKRISRNVCLPLGGIFFIAKSKANRIRQLSAGQALPKIFPVASVPWYHREMAGRVMDFCGELMQNIPMYEFSFRPDESAAEYLLKHIDNPGATV